ncbi:MAG: phosphoribosylaminoimidazolesuccinocarboxamide synthase [Verrucomicrobiae bacterium]|nr:phosphoribosylaminoimidazolesuccinocarboxamide synthase [Verrucomicrobiae bacterium]
MVRREIIQSQLRNCVVETNLPGKKIQGKVRDIYPQEDEVIFVSTDRLSAFDRVLAAIPFKGQVLNLTSKWWFDKTRHIIPNHFIAAPDPAVTVGKKCEVFMVEFVVRGYMTGSTSTSLWTHYRNGSRNYCGNALPDGLVKSQKLEKNILTPTTKSEHDEPVSLEQIVSMGLMSEDDLRVCAQAALELFAFGQEVAKEHGLILVDTKYEFGRDKDGVIRLIDEIHTPDSSRYWLAGSYEERFKAGENPENIDKEFIRLWFRDHCDPYKDEVLPEAPDDLIVELTSRYIQLFEMITGETFPMDDLETPASERIAKNLAAYL